MHRNPFTLDRPVDGVISRHLHGFGKLVGVEKKADFGFEIFIVCDSSARGNTPAPQTLNVRKCLLERIEIERKTAIRNAIASSERM